MIGLRNAAARLWGSKKDSGDGMPDGRAEQSGNGRTDGQGPDSGGGGEPGPNPLPSMPAASNGRGGEYAGSRLCNPNGLPGGAAPDIGRGIVDLLGGAKAEPPDEEDAKEAAAPPAPPAPPARRKGSAARRKPTKAHLDFDMADSATYAEIISGIGRNKLARGFDRGDGAPRLCAVLDTNAAVQYGMHAAGRWPETRLDDEFRDILCDKSVEKVGTPAVMNEVWGLYRGKRLNEDAMKKIRGILVKGGGGAYDDSARVAGAIEAEQRRVAGDPKSDTAERWLAAKRMQHQNATGADYGSPGQMWRWGRRKNLAKLCEMAARDRGIMGEAACVAARRNRTLLLSSDADVSLFEGALKAASRGSIGVVDVTPARRRGRGG